MIANVSFTFFIKFRPLNINLNINILRQYQFDEFLYVQLRASLKFSLIKRMRLNCHAGRGF